MCSGIAGVTFLLNALNYLEVLFLRKVQMYLCVN